MTFVTNGVLVCLCKTTCHPAFFDKLPTFWAVKSNIQVSGVLTTSRGPGTCFVFALCLVEQLFGESVAKEIGELLVSGEPCYCNAFLFYLMFIMLPNILDS